MQFNKYKFIRSLVLLGLICWMFISTFAFVISTTNYEESNFEKTLKYVSKNNSNSIEILFEKYTNTLSVATNYFEQNTYVENVFESFLNDLSNIEDFSYVKIVSPDNSSYFMKNNELIISSYAFTEQMKNGETYVSEVCYDEILETEVVYIHVPIISDEDVISYLIGTIKTETLSEHFNSIFYDVGGYFQVVDSNGAYIASSNSDQMLAMDTTFIDGLSRFEYYDGHTYDELYDGITNSGEGFTKYSYGDNFRTAYYSPIGINGWIMFAVIPQEVISESINNNLSSMSVLGINMILGFSLLITWVYRSQNKLKRSAEENERNIRFVTEQTNKLLLEINFKNSTIKITGKTNHITGHDISSINYLSDELTKIIHPDDHETSMNIISDLENGKKVIDVKLRFLHVDGHYIWCVLSGVPIYDDNKNGALNRAICFLKDDDENERERMKLKTLSELDLLTQIYNKGTSEKLIANILANSDSKTDKHSLLIIDLDNFKEINDSFGHQFGDNVIRELADYLKNTFRSDDIVGRLGGDEFFVLIKNIKSNNLINSKCEDICKNFNKTYEQSDKKVTISASIGVSNYPEHGKSFSELYKHSDIALYKTKYNGKNGFGIFDGDLSIDYISNRTDIDN